MSGAPLEMTAPGFSGAIVAAEELYGYNPHMDPTSPTLVTSPSAVVATAAPAVSPRDTGSALAEELYGQFGAAVASPVLGLPTSAGRGDTLPVTIEDPAGGSPKHVEVPVRQSCHSAVA